MPCSINCSIRACVTAWHHIPAHLGAGAPLYHPSSLSIHCTLFLNIELPGWGPRLARHWHVPHQKKMSKTRVIPDQPDHISNPASSFFLISLTSLFSDLSFFLLSHLTSRPFSPCFSFAALSLAVFPSLLAALQGKPSPLDTAASTQKCRSKPCEPSCNSCLMGSGAISQAMALPCFHPSRQQLTPFWTQAVLPAAITPAATWKVEARFAQARPSSSLTELWQ